MTTDFLISILMPVKNASTFLNPCLESVVHQTETNWELIAVDDHSDDNSFEILSNFEKRDPRIKVLRSNSTGIIDALRLAYENSNGQLISRMDADDEMTQEKLAELKNLLVNSGEGSIATGLVKYISSTTLGDGYLKYEQWLNALAKSQSNFSQIYKECVIPSPCWMLHKFDFEKCGGFNNNVYPEDYDLCFRFYKNNLKVVSSDKILHLWRDHPTRSSRTQAHYSQQNYFDLKLPYFLELEYKENDELFLLGAGSKGKLLAKKLIDINTSFQWTTNNENKIGHDIYGKILQKQSTIFQSKNPKVIVSISGPEEVAELRELLEENGLNLGKEYHLFF